MGDRRGRSSRLTSTAKNSSGQAIGAPWIHQDEQRPVSLLQEEWWHVTGQRSNRDDRSEPTFLKIVG
jgi:hypothetical protein